MARGRGADPPLALSPRVATLASRPVVPHTPAMYRVLIIEDDLRLAAMVATYLRGTGFTVEQAPDGAAGLAALAARDGPGVDLVLLDIAMPGMDGLTWVARYADLPPVVFTTAHDDRALEAFEVHL